MTFRIYPAIDIKEGRCVRLLQGDFKRETVYFQDPLEAALLWKEQGARRLHVVDLDGAKRGKPVNRDIILKMAERTGLPIQCGGGIRSADDIKTYLEGGISRVILGSSAIYDRTLLSEAILAFVGRVLVGLDLRGGRAALHGWNSYSSRPLTEVLKSWKEIGIEELVVTDIERDGTLKGFVATETILSIAGEGFRVIASGGVSSMEDLRNLRGLSERGVCGAVVGKALYDGRIKLSDALALEEDEEEDAGQKNHPLPGCG